MIDGRENVQERSTGLEDISFDNFVDEFRTMLSPEEIENDNDDIEEESQAGTEQPGENTETSIKNTDTEITEESTEENSSPLFPYAKFLVDEGILPNLDLKDFDGTPVGLTTAMTKEIDYGIESYKNQLPDTIKKLIDNYEEGAPLSSLIEIEDRRIQYNSITEDQIINSKDLQKAIVRDYYKQTSQFSDDKIEKLIQRSEDLDELEEEAKTSKIELVKIQDYFEKQILEDSKTEQLRLKKIQDENLNNFKTLLEKTDEVIPGNKLNPTTKDQIYKLITTPVMKDSQGNLLNAIGKYKIENPIEFDILLGNLFIATKQFKDWSILSKAGKKQAISEFETSISKQNYRNNNSVNKFEAKSQDDILKTIESIKW